MAIEFAIMALVALLVTGMSVERKPRFDVPEERKFGANLHWFSLLQGNEAVLAIKQIYFGLGSEFEEAGWRIPNGKSGELISLVVLQSDIITVNSRGDQTWGVALITQGPVGDLYRECWQAFEKKQMEWIGPDDIITSPLSPHPDDHANRTIRLFDCFQAAGSYQPQAVIRHEGHPTNPARSMYVMTDWSC